MHLQRYRVRCSGAGAEAQSCRVQVQRCRRSAGFERQSDGLLLVVMGDGVLVPLAVVLLMLIMIREHVEEDANNAISMTTHTPRLPRTTTRGPHPRRGRQEEDRGGAMNMSEDEDDGQQIDRQTVVSRCRPLRIMMLNSMKTR